MVGTDDSTPTIFWIILSLLLSENNGRISIILSFGKEKVVVNVGLLEGDKVSIIKKPMPISFKTLNNEKEFEFKVVEYTQNL